LKRRLISTGIALLLTGVLVGSHPGTAEAHNDSCAVDSNGTYCTWFYPRQYPWTGHWFNDDVKLHSWTYATVSDGEGGAVAEKCVHVKRASDGYLEPVACGSGIRDSFVEAYLRPGYLYTRYAGDERAPITGTALFSREP
jgi:hypothetical protein